MAVDHVVHYRLVGPAVQRAADPRGLGPRRLQYAAPPLSAYSEAAAAGTGRTSITAVTGLRVRIVEGSLFDSVARGGDAYILKNVIHDWSADKAAQILRNVRAAIDGAATVLVIEIVIPEHDRESIGKWTDLEMLLASAARERTAAEYRRLLEQAGFQKMRVAETASPYSLVEAWAG